MQWALDFLPLPPCPELGTQPLSGILWALLVLFLWYCYRVGSDPPVTGRVHPGKLKSGCARAGRMSRSGSYGSGSGGGTDSGTGAATAAIGNGGTPCIAMETEEEEEDAGRRRGYLTPVLGHALFPAQASPASRKLYSALQEYAKRYSWAGMGRIHKGLRDQARLSDRSSIQKPHLFFLPDVPSTPFFPRDAHRHDIEVLEASYPIILAEFQAVYQRGIDPKLGWTCQGPKVHFFSSQKACVCHRDAKEVTGASVLQPVNQIQCCPGDREGGGASLLTNDFSGQSESCISRYSSLIGGIAECKQATS